jgi:hypothetical protein
MRIFIIRSLFFTLFYTGFVTYCIATDVEDNPVETIIKRHDLKKFDDVLDLPVVHATRVFPKNGIMIPGKSAAKDCDKNGLNIKKGDLLTGPIEWRPTLHWAIGKLANDIDENILSDRPYAVITTLKQLLP